MGYGGVKNLKCGFLQALSFKQFHVISELAKQYQKPHFLQVLYLSLIEPSSPWCCKFGVYVWDAWKSVCCYGKTPWRHAGDDLVKWKGQVARTHNEVFNYSGKKSIRDRKKNSIRYQMLPLFNYSSLALLFGLCLQSKRPPEKIAREEYIFLPVFMSFRVQYTKFVAYKLTHTLKLCLKF